MRVADHEPVIPGGRVIEYVAIRSPVSWWVSPITSDILGISGSPNSGRRSRSSRYRSKSRAFRAIGSGNSKASNLLHRRLQPLPLMSTTNTEGAPIGSESTLNTTCSSDGPLSL